PRQQNATLLVECKKHSGESVIEIENVAFECMYEKLVFLRTAQSAPGTGDVIVVDADTQKVVFRDSPGDLEVSVIDGGLVYWAAARALKDEECGDATVGFGCVVREKVSVNLRTKKRTSLGETMKLPIQ